MTDIGRNRPLPPAPPVLTKPTKPAPPKPTKPVPGPTPVPTPSAPRPQILQMPMMVVPVAAQAQQLVRAYDRNGDGSVNVALESAKFIGNRTTGHTVSIERLARVADNQGLRDGTASQEEIQAVVAQYDVGAPLGTKVTAGGPVAGDGMLTGIEYQNFLEDFGPEHGPSFMDSIMHADRPTQVSGQNPTKDLKQVRDQLNG